MLVRWFSQQAAVGKLLFHHVQPITIEEKATTTAATHYQAPHSKLREATRPTPRQQGKEADEATPDTPYWHWARLLKRVFNLEMTTCPVCRQGTLRLISVITQESVMTRILRHLQLASVPPPIAPSRVRQEIWAFT